MLKVVAILFLIVAAGMGWQPRFFFSLCRRFRASAPVEATTDA